MTKKESKRVEIDHVTRRKDITRRRDATFLLHYLSSIFTMSAPATTETVHNPDHGMSGRSTQAIADADVQRNTSTSL